MAVLTKSPNQAVSGSYVISPRTELRKNIGAQTASDLFSPGKPTSLFGAQITF